MNENFKKVIAKDEKIEVTEWISEFHKASEKGSDQPCFKELKGMSHWM